MNSKQNITMKTQLRTFVLSATLIVALFVGAFQAPVVSVAHASTGPDFSFGFPDFTFPDLTFPDLDLTTATCSVRADSTEIFAGGSVTLTWETEGFDVVTINGQTMNSVDGVIQMTNILQNTTYRLTASSADGSSNCTASVTITCLPVPVDCRLEISKVVDKTTAAVGDTLTYTIKVKNVGTTDCTGSGVKIEDVLSDKLTYLSNTTSSNITPGYEGGIPVFTPSTRTVVFNGNVLTPQEEGTMTIVARVNTPTNCGSYEIPNQARATALELNSFRDYVTSATVKTTVRNDCPGDTSPVCEAFTATPATLGPTGGPVTLSWRVKDASNITITPTIGSVAAIGSQVTNVTSNTTFVLTARDADGDEVSCSAPVTLTTTPPPPPTLSCAENVTFTASDTSIDDDESTTLTWSTRNVDSVSISNTSATGLSGSVTVSPNDDTTYVLTARKGTQSVDCPLTINVDSGGGGGGGGSSSPRCELTVSDKSIKRGEQVTLRWETSRATKVELEDDRGKTLMTTDDYRGDKKEDYYDGSIKVKPTRDTEYTLTASRGSKDRTCKVKVDVDDITVLTDRDQQPLVAGISLSNVPYTGFEAGPFLTIFFYTLLVAWALFISYIIVSRRRPVSDVVMVEPITASTYGETVRPDVFVASVVAPEVTPATPDNLPTGVPVVGYENLPASWSAQHATDDIVTDIENRAHAQMALLSSDAIRHFIATTDGSLERHAALDQVIADAKATFPLEDGWVVINEVRMRELCTTCAVTPVEAAVSPATLPQGAGSLAEAIVTGNIVAAYEMIGNRPMFALADAAADFDNIIRSRKGEDVTVSNLLKTETTVLSDEKIKKIVAALTGALDGTYTDEASAVKMAIMKAVKEVA